MWRTVGPGTCTSSSCRNSPVVADYDADMGYPISVSIDFIEDAIDDETAFAVSSFQLLDASSTRRGEPRLKSVPPKNTRGLIRPPANLHDDRTSGASLA